MPSSTQTWDDLSLAPSTRYISDYLKRKVFTNHRVWSVEIVTPVLIQVKFKSADLKLIHAFSVICNGGRVKLVTLLYVEATNYGLLNMGGSSSMVEFLLCDPKLEQNILEWFLSINNKPSSMPSIRDVKCRK